MDGLYFYWIFWIYFVITFFFLDDKKLRERLSLWLLSVIILSSTTIFIFSYEISVSILFLLVSSYVYISKGKSIRIFYEIILIFIVMLTYTSFHLFALYDPAWLLFNKKLMLLILICYVVNLLTDQFPLQAVLLTSGMIQGDILYGVILRQIGILYDISHYYILDTIALSSACLLSFTFMKKLSRILENYFKETEGEKRKLS